MKSSVYVEEIIIVFMNEYAFACVAHGPMDTAVYAVPCTCRVRVFTAVKGMVLFPAPLACLFGRTSLMYHDSPGLLAPLMLFK